MQLDLKKTLNPLAESLLVNYSNCHPLKVFLPLIVIIEPILLKQKKAD